MSNINRKTPNTVQDSSPANDSFPYAEFIPDTDSLLYKESSSDPDTIPVLPSQPGTNLSGSEGSSKAI